MMRVTVVQIVDMIAVAHGQVAAVRSVLVWMLVIREMIVVAHGGVHA